MAQSTSSSNPFTVRIQAGAPPAALPAWVPPAGYFADVPMINNPQDVGPPIYDANASSNPFDLWGGSAVLRDYSPLGAQVYYSGGHESSLGLPNVQFSLICDFSALRWSTANVPAAANPLSVFVNGLAPDGTAYCPHTYLGLQELPAGWGGGPQGTLVSFFWAGTTYESRINLLDVASKVHGYSQLATIQAQNIVPNKIRFSAGASGGNYPISVMDEQRQGWWLAVNGAADYTLFVGASGAITQYPALGGNLSNGAMALCPSLNLLVALDGGYSAGQYASSAYRNLYIRNLATGAMTRLLTAGPVPGLGNGYDGGTDNFHRMDALGLQWVDELGCIVGFDQSVTPPAIVKLTPPADNPATTAWTWSTITSLQHWPADAGGQSNLQTCPNNVWSKWRWVPTLHAFVYGTARDRRPQIVKLS